MNGIIYCRVSSKEQTQGTSLESQELACREYARSKHIGILKTFIEQGESAKFADRTQLLELIDFCRKNKGRVQLLLVWKVDRFARNVADHFSVKASLAKYGVRVVSVTEPIDTNPEGKLMETILAGFAQFDNDIRAMRSVQGMRKRLQEGIFPWKAPLGYKSATGPREKKSRPDRPHEPLFGLIKRAWHMLATGAYTKAEIRRLMDSWGVVTERGKPLSPQSVDHLFRNPYYAGVLVDPWSKEEHDGRHLPMVTRAEFARVQRVMSRRHRSLPHVKHRPEFPLRGFVRCSECQYYLTGSFSRGQTKRYAYYHCYTKFCSRRGKSLPTKQVHSEFESFLSEITPKKELLQKLGEMIVRVASVQNASVKAKEARTQNQLERLDKQTQELIRMRSQHLITDSEFMAQKRILFERQASIEEHSRDPKVTVSDIRQRLREIIRPLSHPVELWRALAGPVRRQFEHLVLPVGFVIGRIRTAELGLLFRALGELRDGNTNAVAPTGKSWNQLIAEITAFSDLLRKYHGSESVPK